MKSKFLVICVFFVGSLFVSIALISSYTQAQNSDLAKDKYATSVKEGVMTGKQKEHSKLFDNYKSGKKISETISEQAKTNASRDLQITVLPGTPFTTPVGQYKSSHEFLAEMTASSDAILVGTVKEKSSQVTENGKFIFSDYIFQVEDVVKNNSAKPSSTGELITITRPGGTILFNGFTVTATDQSFQKLDVEEKYILFLKFVSATEAYQSVNPEGSFLINGGKVITLNSSVTSKFRTVEDLSSFTENVYSTFSNNPINQEKK